MEEQDFDHREEEHSSSGNLYSAMKKCFRKKDEYFFLMWTLSFLLLTTTLKKTISVNAMQVIEYALLPNIPHQLSFLLKKAQILAMTNEPRKALIILEKAEMVAPNEPDLYMIRGNVYSHLGKYDKAIEQFNKAVPLARKKKI